jgi:hypothetical protein
MAAVRRYAWWRRIWIASVRTQNQFLRRHPPPGLASGEPDHRLRQVIQFSKRHSLLIETPRRTGSSTSADDDSCGHGRTSRISCCLQRVPLSQSAAGVKAPLKSQHRILAAWCARVFQNSSPSKKTEGAGKAGCRSHPWSACNKKARGRTTGTPDIRPSLHNGLTAYSALSPGTGVLAPVFATMLRIIASAAMRKRIARGISTGMPGPHGLAVRIGLFVRATVSRCNPTRPPHPASTFVTIAIRPS